MQMAPTKDGPVDFTPIRVRATADYRRPHGHTRARDQALTLSTATYLWPRIIRAVCAQLGQCVYAHLFILNSPTPTPNVCSLESVSLLKGAVRQMCLRVTNTHTPSALVMHIVSCAVRQHH
jgi:hypothetical protein